MWAWSYFGKVHVNPISSTSRSCATSTQKKQGVNLRSRLTANRDVLSLLFLSEDLEVIIASEGGCSKAARNLRRCSDASPSGCVIFDFARGLLRARLAEGRGPVLLRRAFVRVATCVRHQAQVDYELEEASTIPLASRCGTRRSIASIRSYMPSRRLP